uniref:Ribonuclease P protein subunit p29 n=1 Tax=Acrobeloides nanus TaxID=290746 RepID=A0A914BVM2_9BILA
MKRRRPEMVRKRNHYGVTLGATLGGGNFCALSSPLPETPKPAEAKLEEKPKEKAKKPESEVVKLKPTEAPVPVAPKPVEAKPEEKQTERAKKPEPEAVRPVEPPKPTEASVPEASKPAEAKPEETPKMSNTQIKYFALEKTGTKPKKVRKKERENFIRRAPVSLKKCPDLKYENFVPLYELWCGYFASLLGNIQKPDERLLKADYHGCLLRVSDATNKSQIGLHGIVLYESKLTFQMITKKDKVIIIPKEGSTLQFVLNGKVFTLFGDALRQRSYLRGRKAKSRLKLPFFI